MSEDAAFRRAKAARLVREYPELREAIAKGEIHLTGVLMIGPHLGGERHAEISQCRSSRRARRAAAISSSTAARRSAGTLVATSCASA